MASHEQTIPGVRGHPAPWVELSWRATSITVGTSGIILAGTEERNRHE